MGRRRIPAEWRRIREIFLHQRESYDAAEVSALLGIPRAAVQDAIDDGRIAAVASGGGLRIAWEDVVALGLEHRWTFRMLTAALRGLGGAALPPLVRVATRPVALPRYQWQVLRAMAARQARAEGREITVSDLIEEAISTEILTKIEDWESVEAEVPGVREAAGWPGTES